MILNYDNADQKVNDLQQQGVDIYWDNYALVLFKPDRRAEYHSSGCVRNGKYGFKTVFPLKEDGTWEISI